MDGQEKERRRIAQELHDRLGSMLSMVKIHFKSVEDQIVNLKESNKKQYEKANQLLDGACEEVRKISHDLISSVLYKFGLPVAIENLVDSIQESGQLEIEFIKSGLEDERYKYETEINIYRILQELISNVLKHSKASEMIVQLIQRNNNLRIQVEDNGVGFDPSNTVSDGIGLQGIRARVDQLEAEMNIDSNPGSGTLINIDIPLLGR